VGGGGVTPLITKQESFVMMPKKYDQLRYMGGGGTKTLVVRLLNLFCLPFVMVFNFYFTLY